MAGKTKKRGYAARSRVASTPTPIRTDRPMTGVSRGAFNEDDRLRAALLNEASFLRTTGFQERGDTLETAAHSLGLASAQRILADLRFG